MRELSTASGCITAAYVHAFGRLKGCHPSPSPNEAVLTSEVHEAGGQTCCLLLEAPWIRNERNLMSD